MLFSSYTFLLFFAVVLIVARFPWSWRGKKFFLLAMSYVFYAAWNPPFVILLWVSTVCDWFLAKWMHTSTSTAVRRLLLLCSLIVNLGLLAYFKYAGFAVETVSATLNAAGIPWHPAAPNIILPVGISFYTFQTLSYSLDVYRRKTEPSRNFLDFALFVTFFPQLVAGPIVRAVDFLPQLIEPKMASKKQLGWGLTLMVVGLFNKLVIADTLVSGIADKVFAVGYQPSILAAWTGAAAFSIQIFCDFSGYSTCAIGVALCLGLVLPDNFRFPYASVGFSDFWRRWHISLSGWLRDYLYISLGGNRKGPIRTMVNLALTMLIGGLWHGASWMFVIWGALHGAALVAERLLRANIPKSPIWSTLPAQLLLAGLTYIFVLYTWVFFRAGTLDSAWTIVSAMSGFASTAAESLGTTRVLTVWVVTAVMLALHWRLRGSSLEAAVQSLPAWLRPLSLAVMMILILLSMAGENSAFIYFQF